jgi:hypothetical protein
MAAAIKSNMDFQNLSDAFRKYAGHMPTCERLKTTASSCSCGFIQVLIQLPVNRNEPCDTPSRLPKEKP